MSILGSLLQGAGSLVGLIPGVGTAVGTAANVVGSTLGSAVSSAEAKSQLKQEQEFNADQAEINRDFQRQERLETQQFNLDMWNMNNEYNSPAEKLKRAEAAGINPNAVIGELGGSNASAVTSTPMSGVSASSPGSLSSSILTQDLEFQKMLGQVRLTNAQATQAEIANQFAPRLNEKAIAKADAEIDEIGAKAGLTREQINQTKEMLPLLKGKTMEEINQLKVSTTKMVEELNEILARTEKTNQEASLLKWKNEFRELYGVTPDSGLVDGIIQLAVSGEKSSNIVNSIFSTLWSAISGNMVSKYVKRNFLPDFPNVVPFPAYGHTQSAPIGYFR